MRPVWPYSTQENNWLTIYKGFSRKYKSTTAAKEGLWSETTEEIKEAIQSENRAKDRTTQANRLNEIRTTLGYMPQSVFC